LNRTSFERTAETSFTGTVTRPKLMFPLQMVLGTRPTSLCRPPTPIASQVVEGRRTLSPVAP
jgi:hypothetical protein